jgi:transcriptional regulator with XRE-family HTH domain
MNATTISLIESGRFDPYPKQLVKLARALGVPQAEAHLLLQEEEAEKSLHTSALRNAEAEGG